MKPYIATAAVVLLSLWGPRESRADLSIHQVAPGIYRGPAPQSEADYQRLKKLGIRTVLNLRKIHRRQIAEERRRLSALGIAHRHVPTAYRFPEASVPQALKVLSDTSLQPIYVHCMHGKDRTGLVVGLFRVRHQGWSSNTAYAEMTRMNFNTRLAGLRNHFWQNASPGVQIARNTPPRGRAPFTQQVASASPSRPPTTPVATKPAASRKPVVAATRVATATDRVATKPAAVKPAAPLPLQKPPPSAQAAQQGG